MAIITNIFARPFAVLAGSSVGLRAVSRTVHTWAARALLVCFIHAGLLALPVEAYKFASGTYTGTGSGFTVDISDTSDFEDFQPTACIVKGDGNLEGVIRIEGMDATSSQPLDGSTAVTTGITALAANGFTISTGSSVNTLSTVYYYVCWANDASNDFSYGTYAGTGVDQDITISPSFQPEMVLVVSDNGSVPVVWRGASSHSGDITSSFSNVADEANKIEVLNADGFNVGTDACCNTNAVSYFYIAFKSGVSTIKTGTYTSNTATCADDCAVTGLGFQPQFILIKGNSTTAPAAKFTPQTGDDSCYMDSSSSCFTNVLQAFGADGFTYGGNAAVNTNGVVYGWFAMREAAATRRPVSPFMFQ